MCYAFGKFFERFSSQVVQRIQEEALEGVQRIDVDGETH